MGQEEQLGGYFLCVLILIVPVWRICRRAGHHPALSLLLLVPGFGLMILACVLAFGRWPALDRPASGEK